MATIKLEQAVRNAIKIERAAETFYRQLAERTEDIKAREFLERMAAQENDHARALEKFGEQLNAGDLSVGADWNVEVVETAPEWAFAENLTLEQAMDIALENEQHAELYYDALADCTEGSVSDFLRDISLVEREHYQRIKKMIESGL